MLQSNLHSTPHTRTRRHRTLLCEHRKAIREIFYVRPGLQFIYLDAVGASIVRFGSTLGAKKINDSSKMALELAMQSVENGYWSQARQASATGNAVSIDVERCSGDQPLVNCEFLAFATAMCRSSIGAAPSPKLLG